jgi:ribonuclease HI
VGTQHYIVYTDGACSGNPGPGGWAFYVIADGFSAEEGGQVAQKGGVPMTTSNQMELQAAIEALEWLQDNAVSACTIRVHTDSKYLHGGMTEWLPRWKAKHWRTLGKTPVANREQWERLDRLAQNLTAAGMKVDWEWIEGHAGDQWNLEVDRLATEAYQKFKEPKARKSQKKTKTAPTEGEFMVRVPIKGTKRMMVLVDSEARVRVWTNRAEAEAEARKRGGAIFEWTED